MPKEPRVSKLRPTPYGRPAAKPMGLWSRIKSFFSAPPPPAELGPPQLVSRENSITSETENLPGQLNAFEANYESSHVSEFPSNLGADLLRVEQPVLPANVTDPLLNTSTLTPNEALEQFFAEKGDAELSNVEVMGALSLIGQAVGRNESLIDLSNLGELSSHLTSFSSSSANDDRTSFDPASSVLRNVHAPSPRPYRQGTPPPAIRRASSRSSLNSRHRSSLLRSDASPWGSPHPYARPSNAFSARMGIQTPRQPIFSVRNAASPVPATRPSDSAAVQAIKRAIAPPSANSELLNRRSRYVQLSAKESTEKSEKESSKKPIKQSSNGSVEKAIDESVKRAIDESIESIEPFDKPNNQPTPKEMVENPFNRLSTSSPPINLPTTFSFAIPPSQTAPEMSATERRAVSQFEAEFEF